MTRPNIVFVHVDQMHADAVSAYGNPHVSTPNLDRIAAAGRSFRRSYTAMPQCCPARASWYTGRMSKEHGVVVNGCPIDPALPDLGQWLRKHGGYETVYTGKWHVSGRDVHESFDVLVPSGQGEVNDAAVARSACAFLRNRERGGKPFFLNVGFMNPHDCCYTAGAAGGVGKFRLAGDIRALLPPLPGNWRRNPAYAGRTAGWGQLEWQYYIYSYYRQVEMADAEIGRLYDALRASPHAANTILIFTADHGDGLGFHGKVSKGYLEDEAWRVPAIVVTPEQQSAGVQDTDHLVSGVDIAATICDYAQTPPLPRMTQARSWRPLMEGTPVTWRTHVIGETSIGGTSTGVRDSRWKTIFHEDGRVQVYDMDEDPLEKTNLAETDAGKAVTARHRGLFRDYIGEIDVCEESPRPKRLKPARKALFGTYSRWYAAIAGEEAAP